LQFRFAWYQSITFLIFVSFIFDCIFYAGTHVAGIIAANTTGIKETVFIPYVPFIGVAPQVTIGACELI
jgi:hypothetical protein